MSDMIKKIAFAAEIAAWLNHFNVTPYRLSILAGLNSDAVGKILRCKNPNEGVLKSTESKIRNAMERLHPTAYVKVASVDPAKKQKNYPSDGLPHIKGESFRNFKNQVLRFLKNNPDISVGKLSRSAGLGHGTLAFLLHSDANCCRSVTAALTREAMKALNAGKLDKPAEATPAQIPEVLANPTTKHRIADLENMSREQLILLVLKMQDAQP